MPARSWRDLLLKADQPVVDSRAAAGGRASGGEQSLGVIQVPPGGIRRAGIDRDVDQVFGATLQIEEPHGQRCTGFGLYERHDSAIGSPGRRLAFRLAEWPSLWRAEIGDEQRCARPLAKQPPATSRR